MDNQTECSISPEEVEPFLSAKPVVVRKVENRPPETSAKAAKVNFEQEKDDDNSNLVKWFIALTKEDKTISIKIWKNCTISISKILIPLRLATVLWFGAGRIITVYLGVFLRERGLTLTEISSTYSLIFVSQLVGSSISGIIADKIGNAKPVLIFHMCATLATIICILFIPNIGNESCALQNFTLGIRDFENKTDFEYCSYTCFESFRGIFQISPANDDATSNNTLLEKVPLFLESNTKFFFNISESAALDDYPWNKSCITSCLGRFQRDCSLTHRKVFVILYSILILTLFAFWSPTYRFLDYSSLCLADLTESHFGKERSFGSVGDLIISPIAVFVLIAGTSMVKRYQFMFWISAALILLSALSACKIKAVILPPGRKLTRKALKLMKNSEVIAFIAVVFIAGNGFSFNAVFNFWFLDNINAPKLVIGLHPIFSALYSIPALLTSHLLIKQLETNKILILGLLAYAVNQFSFSFLSNPWLSLITEMTVAFHFHFLWIATVVQSRELAPKGLKATLNAMAGAFHFGVGRSSGVAIGGLLVNYFGIRSAYRLMSALCLSTAVLYSLFLNREYLMPRKKRGHDSEITEDTESLPVKDSN